MQTVYHTEQLLNGHGKKNKKKTPNASSCIEKGRVIVCSYLMCQGHSQEVCTPLAVTPLFMQDPPRCY